MKLWSLYLSIYSVYTQYQALALINNAIGEEYQDSECIAGLSMPEATALEHFNGIFGEFIMVDNEEKVQNASIFGPIAASYIQSNGYSYNTNGYKSSNTAECPDYNHPSVPHLGLLSYSANVREANIAGAVWTKYGAVHRTLDNARDRVRTECPECAHPIPMNGETWEELWSFAPDALRNISRTLAALEPDTVIRAFDKGYTPMKKKSTLEGVRVLKFPACSDRKCEIVSKQESTVGILKGDESLATKYFTAADTQGKDTVVFNIPVYVGGKYTISTLDVNKDISPCQAIFNFYPVNQIGEFVNSPNATFTLIRSPDVTIAGTILAPQANIVDSHKGYFGGQLLTLQRYEGQGANILNFHSASTGACASRSLCLFKRHAPFSPPNMQAQMPAVPKIGTRGKYDTLDGLSTYSLDNSNIHTVTEKLEPSSSNLDTDEVYNVNKDNNDKGYQKGRINTIIFNRHLKVFPTNMVIRPTDL
ncbi:hypothetical protein BDF20DRAFT_830947 [Mycotypha africana]|uniref:uncharacterized protein n=1 Tax=Mycotypha africana TaxID=64632 RepID=UPI0023014EB9|nr:uncharacterized protein BDF20DRAFT_830947 [Mycotypha africana]KAI8990856.1 hypothetical protein BDF20DRAFT_830947 [Mycotypha africana]